MEDFTWLKSFSALSGQKGEEFLYTRDARNRLREFFAARGRPDPAPDALTPDALTNLPP